MLPACTEVLSACSQMLPADFIPADFEPDIVSADNVVEVLPACTEVLCTTTEVLCTKDEVLCTTEVLPT